MPAADEDTQSVWGCSASARPRSGWGPSWRPRPTRPRARRSASAPRPSCAPSWQARRTPRPGRSAPSLRCYTCQASHVCTHGLPHHLQHSLRVPPGFGAPDPLGSVLLPQSRSCGKLSPCHNRESLLLIARAGCRGQGAPGRRAACGAGGAAGGGAAVRALCAARAHLQVARRCRQGAVRPLCTRLSARDSPSCGVLWTSADTSAASA